MTAVKELNKIITQHKNISKSVNGYLKANDGRLRIASSSGSGITLVNWIPSSAVIEPITVDLSVLSSFVKGSGDLNLTVKDNRLLIKGNRLRGDLPGVSDDVPRIPKVDKFALSAAESQWLKETIPYVAIPELDKSGSLAVECINQEWRIACTDSTYGACAFGKGNSTIKFALIPSDALVLNSVLSTKSKGIKIGLIDGRLVVSTDDCIVAIPTIDGEAQTKENVSEGTKLVAKMKGAELTAAINTLKPFAGIKDAPPVIFQLMENAVIIKASSASGAIEHRLQAKCSTNLSIPLSFELLSNLVSKVGSDTVSLRVLIEGTENKGDSKREVTRITLQTQFAQYLMLTSSV